MDDIQVASLVHTVSSHTGDVNWVCFSGQNLASSSGDKTVRLWKLDDFNEQACSPLLGHTYHVHCCVFSPFGTLLASCSTDGKAILWDAKSGEQIATLYHKSKASVRVCRFSPDSSVLATGSEDESLCLWDVSSRKLIRTFVGHEATVTALAFSPDSTYIISGSTNGDIRLWDARYGHGQCLSMNLDAHDLGVTCCEFSSTYGSASNSDSMQRVFLLASCGNDNLVKLWDIISTPGGPSLSQRCELVGHDAPVMACCFSPNGKFLASASGDKTVRLWNPLKAGELIHVIEGHTRYVTCCAFSPSGQLLATGSNDRTIKIWKLVTGVELSYSTDIESEGDLTIDISELSIKRHCEDWNIDDVCEWVRSQGLEQYCDSFREQAIDGCELFQLKDSDLENSLEISEYSRMARCDIGTRAGSEGS
ncbi:WD repeat, SAM and U-box domain-containing protein 1-like isoform X2 [Tubulanus polymorphus]|uniref:WD repeat, SAM and U-box domain-containing protein 1-like isoform X2 n=1 Tax=Tubulanus polymorphus TaxID=672921 RepID=UPI003DA61CCA